MVVHGPARVLAGLLVTLVAIGTLLLSMDSGWMRTCTAVVGALAPLVGAFVHVTTKAADVPDHKGGGDARHVREVPASTGD